MAVKSSGSDFDSLTRALLDTAKSIEEGYVFQRLPEPDAPAAAEVCRAVNRVIDAMAAREAARKQITDGNNDVLLALEELAREQAEALARQNAELREQNAALRRADRLKDEFLASVSHELRTPLIAVIGFSELLLEGIAGGLPAEQAEYVSDIRSAGQHLLGIITDILDLAKFGAGRLHFDLRPIDLLVPLREAEEIARPLVRKKDQVFTVQVGEPVPCIGDPVRIRQIALNLISNAVKFTPRTGRITLMARRAGEAAELQVEDSGIGIDPKHHALVFEMFQQVDMGAAREFPGTGLGLALVKRFTEAMGGTVSLRSHVGQGSTFTVRLPSASPAQLGQPARQP